MFSAGQAVEIGIADTPKWKDVTRFILTDLTKESYLELTLKIYPEHNGFTQALSEITINSFLLICKFKR